MNKYDICGFDKEQELNNLHNENDLEKELKEITLKADLDRAIEYYVEHADIEELKEQIKWYCGDYGARNIYCLKNAMFESYLDNYNEEELKERIKMLYE